MTEPKTMIARSGGVGSPDPLPSVAACSTARRELSFSFSEPVGAALDLLLTTVESVVIRLEDDESAQRLAEAYSALVTALVAEVTREHPDRRRTRQCH